MGEEGKADWEIRLERYLEKPVQEVKVDKTLRSSQLQALLTEIEKAAGKAKTWLAANMMSEVRAELERLRGLLKLLKAESPSSIELIASLLKAGISEKVLKEIYGATEEEIEKAKGLLEKRHRFRAWFTTPMGFERFVEVYAENKEEARKLAEKQVPKGSTFRYIYKVEESSSAENESTATNPDPEADEEEYRELRRRARLAVAERLLP